MIAGTHSSVGKTTWSLALAALAKRRGLRVQLFKAGPDYIDTGFHHQVCAPRKSRNLDLFLLSREEVKSTFCRNTVDADLAIVEGMMGLYDGKNASGHEGSSAELAKLLYLPVFLVVDGSGLATSAAAVVLGFQKFDPELNLAGILFNGVKSEGHFRWLKRAVEEKTGIACLGYLPHEEALKIPERHLGLKTAVEMPGVKAKAEQAAMLLEKHFDWSRFCTVSRMKRYVCSSQRHVPLVSHPCFRVGVAYDRAFSFYYEDNFDLLKQAGAEIVFFSPLNDHVLPERPDLLYLGGGFPELYAPGLSENHEMIRLIREFYQGGGFIYAECGGLIYLSEAFYDSSGKRYPFVGFIPGTVRMTDRLQNFGYHELTALSDTFLFPAGKKLRSHEFHYSVWEHSGSFPLAYRIGERQDGFVRERLLASYQHLHFGSDETLVKTLARHCHSRKAPALPSEIHL